MINNLQNKIIKTIKEGGLNPRPRWHFLLKNKFIWSLGVLSLIIGSASVSVIIYLFNNNLAMDELVGESFLVWLLLSLPYFWLAFLALFIYLLYYNIKHTSRGYRYRPVLVVVGAILVSIVLGSFFSGIGFGKRIDSVLGERAPLYDTMFNSQIKMWSKPQQGRLMGLVVDSQSNDHFMLSDRSGVRWQILHNEKRSELLNSGQVLRLIGRISGENEFTAERIVPMHSGGNFFLRQKPEMRKSLHLQMMNKAQDCSEAPIILNNRELIEIIEESLSPRQSELRELVSEDERILSVFSCLGLSENFIDQVSP